MLYHRRQLIQLLIFWKPCSKRNKTVSLVFLSSFRNILFCGRTLEKQRKNSASPRFLSTLSRVLPYHSMFLRLGRNTCYTVLFLFWNSVLSRGSYRVSHSEPSTLAVVAMYIHVQSGSDDRAWNRKKLECHQNLLWQFKNNLACNFSFHLAIKIFSGMPIPHFGLSFCTWHAAISCPGWISTIFIWTASIQCSFQIPWPFLLKFDMSGNLFRYTDSVVCQK